MGSVQAHRARPVAPVVDLPPVQQVRGQLELDQAAAPPLGVSRQAVRQRYGSAER